MKENTMAIVDRAFDPEVTPSPFGERWGGELFVLSPAHLAALQAGETLALDVMGEYITFIAMEKPDQAPNKQIHHEASHPSHLGCHGRRDT